MQQVVLDTEGDFVSLADHFEHILIDSADYSPVISRRLLPARDGTEPR